MKIRSTQGMVVVGGAALAVLLGVASVAWACVPGHISDSNRFNVTPGSAGTGTLMTAVGNDLERGNWPYTIKLTDGALPTNLSTYNGKCGREGRHQTVARTGDTPGHPLYHSNTASEPWTDHDFNQLFVLNAAGLPDGPAHFCAIPGQEPTTSAQLGTQAYLKGFSII